MREYQINHVTLKIHRLYNEHMDVVLFIIFRPTECIPQGVRDITIVYISTLLTYNQGHY